MDTATRVQILDENDSISHSTNTTGKGNNPIILPCSGSCYLVDMFGPPNLCCSFGIFLVYTWKKAK